MTYQTIEQTNYLVRRAIAHYRIDPGPHTKSAVYDALRKRRNARDYVMPRREREEWERLANTELTFAEKQAMIGAFMRKLASC